MRNLGLIKEFQDLLMQMNTVLMIYNGVAVFILGGKGQVPLCCLRFCFQHDKILFIVAADFFFIATESINRILLLHQMLICLTNGCFVQVLN